MLTGLRKNWPLLSEEEIRRHNSRCSLWIVSGNSVYDVTEILSSHPGGEAAILRRGGGAKDCGRDYSFHSRYARREWEGCKIGEIIPEDVASFHFIRGTSEGAMRSAATRSHPEVLTTTGTNHGGSSSDGNGFTQTVDAYASTTTTLDQRHLCQQCGQCSHNGNLYHVHV